MSEHESRPTSNAGTGPNSKELGELGWSHHNRFQRFGELNDIDTAIKYGSLALDLTPDSHSNLALRLVDLGIFYGGRYQFLGDLGDLERSIKYKSRALALTPDGHPDLPRRHTTLGVSYGNRFQRLGEVNDLEKSIEHKSRALALTPDGHPDLPRQLTNLGVSHSHRFKRLGDLGDLGKGIEYQSRALALTPDGHPDLPHQLTNLGVSHSHRFECLGDLSDLEKAIEYQSRALALTPDSHPDLPHQLTNLGVSHSHRFECLGDLGDLEKAIEYQSRALALTPDGHPDLPHQLTNLGVSHSHRFECLGDLSDLEKAIEYQSRALALTPDSHPDLPHQLTNLGVSHSHRFKRLGDLGDLEKAIEYQSRALVLTPDGHPTLPDKHFTLAAHRFFQYRRTGEASELHDSLHSFRLATQSLAGSPRDKFKYASVWAGLTSSISALNPIEAYQTAINLLPQFIWLGATTNQRYQDLEQVQNLAINAAAAAIATSNFKLALEWLEHARCVVWNQHLMLRSPLDQLHASHPILATRLDIVSNQLHHAGSESPESQAPSSGSLTSEQVCQKRRQLAKEYEDLLSQARTLPGFEDFLKPMKANRLVQAARIGPIVVLNCHESRCDALVILPQQETIDHIPLPNFTGEKAQRIRLDMERSVRLLELGDRGATRRSLGEEGNDSASDFESVLEVLWHDIVKPVLVFLGYMNIVPAEDLPHITWCPTGALSFLPLHAAGDYGQPQSRVFNYAISSYTPTLTALLSSARGTLNHDTRVLAIGQSHTPGHSPLPGTTRELAYVKAHTLNKAEYFQLVDEQATTTAVLDAMKYHDWVHLACHAHQNVDDPTKSGFSLHDGTLDLASINRRSFKNKGLAFLSSGNTAAGNERLPDEAVHLASGMLMAGYTSIIASMWSVVDEDAPLVADKVYAQLMQDGKLGNGEAGRALHYAVAALRDKVGEKKFARWVPYIHIGS
ncbi:hypothetical protein FRC11_003253 [Ceratobasidium sp. 423]|nr:hypothetical protein FRC11_003253 [Ceratobasidium sp. 423]